MSLEALGQRVGVTYQQNQKYETGTNRISASMLWRIADPLHLRVGWFSKASTGYPVDCRRTSMRSGLRGRWRG